MIQKNLKKWKVCPSRRNRFKMDFYLKEKLVTQNIKRGTALEKRIYNKILVYTVIAVGNSYRMRKYHYFFYVNRTTSIK